MSEHPAPKNKDYYLKNDINDTEFLLSLGKIFTSGIEIYDLLNSVLALIAKNLHITRGSINIYYKEIENIFIDASYGYTPDEIARGQYRPGEGIVGKVISTGKPIAVPSLRAEPLFLNRTGARKKESMANCAFICVPVKIESAIIGTLSVDKTDIKDESCSRELTLLTTVSIMIAHALKARRENLLEKFNRENSSGLHQKKRLLLNNGSDDIIGTADCMQKLYEDILLVAPTNSTVLINGETGTGKELIAQAIHTNSWKDDSPFVKVNIAAFPASLIESELFGHEKGAFTGAVSQRKGRFELAHGGTLFLDEIGDLNPELQVKLLRVLQEKSFERLGGSKTINTDVRIIAATNKNLEEKIETGEFRQDLFYRLNVFPIYSPPLRERKADIILLADHFVEKYCSELKKEVKRISSDSIDMLVSYHWPGNVRELENCIHRSIIMSNEDVIRSYHLPPSLQIAEEDKVNSGTLQEMTDKFVREIIIDHLKITEGNITAAAQLLGTTKRILNYRIKQLGIDYIYFKKFSCRIHE